MQQYYYMSQLPSVFGFVSPMITYFSLNITNWWIVFGADNCGLGVGISWDLITIVFYCHMWPYVYTYSAPHCLMLMMNVRRLNVPHAPQTSSLARR